jgi:hypothetical protein
MSYFGLHSPLFTIAAIASVLIVAGCSYLFVEMKFKNILTTPIYAALTRKAFVAFAGIVLASSTVFAFSGFEWRSEFDIKRAAEYRLAMADWTYPSNCGGVTRASGLKKCVLGAEGGRRILVLGDSFAQQLYSHFKTIADREQNLLVQFATAGGCPPMANVNRLRPGVACSEFFHAAADDALKGHYDTIVIASIWAPYFVADDERPLLFN